MTSSSCSYVARRAALLPPHALFVWHHPLGPSPLMLTVLGLLQATPPHPPPTRCPLHGVRPLIRAPNFPMSPHAVGFCFAARPRRDSAGHQPPYGHDIAVFIVSFGYSVRFSRVGANHRPIWELRAFAKWAPLPLRLASRVTNDTLWACGWQGARRRRGAEQNLRSDGRVVAIFNHSPI